MNKKLLYILILVLIVISIISFWKNVNNKEMITDSSKVSQVVEESNQIDESEANIDTTLDEMENRDF